jgi:hypothetical protein
MLHDENNSKVAILPPVGDGIGPSSSKSDAAELYSKASSFPKPAEPREKEDKNKDKRVPMVAMELDSSRMSTSAQVCAQFIFGPQKIIG